MGQRPSLVYDRDRRAAEYGDARSRIQFYFMNVSHKVLHFVSYLGVTRIHRAFNRLIGARGFTLVREDGVEFSFPSDDYYWNRLLSTNWRYEPELDHFLQSVRDVPFTFVDLGANFGYWSVRVGGGLYGQHPVISVEASARCFEFLSRNTADLPGSVSPVHAAIEEVSGKQMKLYGASHAGLSLVNGSDTDDAPHELVSTKALDDLIAEHGIDVSATPVIVKLDVEGVEKAALRGGAKTVAGKSVFVIEDVGFGTVSDALDYARDKLNMDIYAMRPDRIVPLSTREQIMAEKPQISRIQQVGVNYLATCSDDWKAILEAKAAEEQVP